MLISQRIRVSGVVQGVGFRPFVWRLARELDLAGWVRNDAAGVEIAAEGAPEPMLAMLDRLHRDAPPLARVDAVVAQDWTPQGCRDFVIIDSRGGAISTAIGHDTAICADCLAELCDPLDRHWRHAFITCTHCGPRYTVTHRLPYDRPQTSLAAFPLCSDCAREYADPADRRFHAETICCPNCGPRLSLLDAQGDALEGDPIAASLALLRAGAIVAIKGLGGFHLVCDASRADAVARLRLRKSREEKPFAVLLANPASARVYAEVDGPSEKLLTSAERPIVLLRKRTDCDHRLPGIAPGLPWLGVMLPSTPIHYLLFHEASGRTAGKSWLDVAQPLALVATSANPCGEALVTGNDEALARLAGIADATLLHDRDIVVRCDDSVLRQKNSLDDKREGHGAQAETQFIRRARGYTPRLIKLARHGPSVLAFGGGYKNTVCVTRGDEAYISQHIGDLDTADTCNFHEESVARLLSLLEITPEIIACDLHPDFHSSRTAAEFAAGHGLPCLSVQHHHAHIASVLAEHQHEGRALGLALDGIGLGTDGGAWGGELLDVDGSRCTRLGSLVPLPLPGGDRAAREPWRMAAAVLWRIGRGGEIAGRFASQRAASSIAGILQRGINCPPTSSLGRVFDAAAALLGVREVMSYEGQPAMLLEGLAQSAWQAKTARPLAGSWRITSDNRLDLLPLLALLADVPDHESALAAARFHATLAEALSEWAIASARASGIATIALGGGCFLNALLARELTDRLNAAGLRTLAARQLPPNDGGLALGQAWIAAHFKEA